MAATTLYLPFLQAHHDVSTLPAHCQPVDDFLFKISSTFHTCVPTYLAFSSTLLGILSITSWLFAQLPQIYKNYQIQSTAGLSIYFLAEWCLGDTTNLVGALLTNQATWQVIVAAYYTFVDCVLVGQYIWYERLGHGRRARKLLAARRPNGSPGAGPSESDPLLANGPTNAAINGSAARSQNKNIPSQNSQFSKFHFPAISGSQREKPNGEQRNSRPLVRTVQTAPVPSPSPRTILLVACLCVALGRASPITSSSLTSDTPLSSASASESTSELVGRIISWFSTALYLLSRLPQLFKNYRRKSTAGLSPVLFAAAFCGNLFYSSSLLTNPLAWADYPAYGHNGWAGADGSHRADWVLSATPFFLGAFGVLGLDAAMGIQFMIYGDARARIPVLVETPPTRHDTLADNDNNAVEPPRSRVLAVPQRRGRPGPGGAADAEEARSWRRVSGWMRGWVPSFSPDSFNRQGYMAAAAAAGRSARDSIGGFAASRGSGDRSASGSRSRSISRVRAEAEEWERRRGSGVDGDVDVDMDADADDERPLLEREDIPGSAGDYGSL